METVEVAGLVQALMVPILIKNKEVGKDLQSSKFLYMAIPYRIGIFRNFFGGWGEEIPVQSYHH